MKALYIITILALSILPVGAGDVGRGAIVSLRVNNGWAGENFSLYNDKEGNSFVVHTVFGSGVRIVSTKMYEVTNKKINAKRNEYQFHIPYEETKELTFTIRRINSTYTLYLFGRELKTESVTKPHNNSVQTKK